MSSRPYTRLESGPRSEVVPLVPNEQLLSTSTAEEDLDDEPEDASIVQFMCPIVYHNFGDDGVIIKVDIARMGNMTGRCSALVYPEETSATKGYNFIGLCSENGSPMKGCSVVKLDHKGNPINPNTNGSPVEASEVVFEDGEFEKTIFIKGVNPPVWSSTLELKVCLVQPQPQATCKLGRYLYECRVKLIDNDQFPYTYKGERTSLQLYLSYFMWNFESPVFPSIDVAYILVMDQLQNMYTVLMLFVNMYMVNVICKPSDETNEALMKLWGKSPTGADEDFMFEVRLWTAYLVAAFHVVPRILFHIWELCETQMNISGRSQLYLQRNLFTKYMNLPEETDIKAEALQSTIMNDAPTVGDGFELGLKLAKFIIKVGFNVLFVMHAAPQATPYVSILPLFIIIWGVFRANCCLPADTDEFEADLFTFLLQAIAKRSLIREFFLRPKMNDKFSTKCKNLEAAQREAHTFSQNTKFILHLLPHLVTAAYIMLDIEEVIKGELQLGTFLATIGAIGDVGGSTISAYSNIMAIRGTFFPLQGIAEFLNMRTDLADWRYFNRKRHERTSALMDELCKAKAQGNVVDRLPVECLNVEFRFSTPGPYVLFQDVSLKVAQGNIVAVLGEKTCGKHMFMRILSGQTFPTNERVKADTGYVYLPSHLRVLLVSRQAVFLAAPLLENLTVGLADLADVHQSDKDHIVQLLDMFGLKEDLGGYILDETKMHDPNWSGKITFTEFQILGLIRAFIMNPEVMCLLRPFTHYDTKQAAIVWKLFEEYRDNKGVLMKEKTIHLRRPRTVFFTTESVDRCEAADVTWYFKPMARSTPASFKKAASKSTWKVVSVQKSELKNLKAQLEAELQESLEKVEDQLEAAAGSEESPQKDVPLQAAQLQSFQATPVPVAQESHVSYAQMLPMPRSAPRQTRELQMLPMPMSAPEQKKINDGFKDGNNGLQYRELQQGQGPEIRNGQKVKVNFLLNNAVTGASVGKGSMFEFTVGSKDVMPAFNMTVMGWNTTESGGIRPMQLKGARQVIIPPGLGIQDGSQRENLDLVMSVEAIEG